MVKRISIGLIATLSIIALALTLVGPPTFFKTNSSPSFIVKDARGDAEFFSAPSSDVERIEMNWIHSIEKEPWREVYRIDGTQLLLTDVYLEGFGAGVPSDLEGTTVNEGGVVHTSGINRPIPSLNWVHSHSTHHSLSIFLKGHDAPITLDNEIEHHTFTTAFVSTN